MQSSMVINGLKFVVALYPELVWSWQMSFLDFFTAGSALAVLAAGAAGVEAAGEAGGCAGEAGGFAGATAEGAEAAAVAGLAGAGVAAVCAKVVAEAPISAAVIKVDLNTLSPKRQKRLFTKRCKQMNR